MAETYQAIMPVCPHCGHEFDADDMNAASNDLWAAAPDESRFQVVCPNVNCARDFWLQGGYRPQYTTAISEDDL